VNTDLRKPHPDVRDELLKDDPWTVVVGYILYRVAFGLRRVSQRRLDHDGISSSALRSLDERAAHYRELLKWFTMSAPTQETRECAEMLSSMAATLK
jgi:hypothetical protein